MNRLLPVALVLGLALTLSACGDYNKTAFESGCSKSTAAKCVNDVSEAQCVTECNALWNNPTCQKEIRAFLTCASKTNFTCDSSGEATPPDTACVSEGEALSLCLFP